MAVAWFRNPVLDETSPIIDRDSVNERTFGKSIAKRHPAYVYSIRGASGLMHRVARVTIDHYAIVTMHKLGRLKVPAMRAECMCGMSFALLADHSRTCTVPDPAALLCGRCHGQPATFGRHCRGRGISRQEAHVRLGCVVNGYPSLLEKDGAVDARILKVEGSQATGSADDSSSSSSLSLSRTAG